MERRNAAGRGRRGGESIPPLRAIYVRLGVDVAAIAVAIGLAVYPALSAGKLAPLVYSLTGAALCFLLLPLLWHGRGVWLPLFLLATAYTVAESFGHVRIASVPAYAAGLIVLCELLFWAAELPPSARVDLAVVGGRLLSLAVIAVAAVALAPIALLATTLQVSSALFAALLGSLAASMLLAIPLVLLRARGSSR
jgi:hypothetical protein